MSALTAPRKIQRRDVRQFVLPVAAGVACTQSGLAILADGVARPGRAGQGADNTAKAADAATYKAVGVFVESVTGGAADGDVEVRVDAGCFNFANSAGGDEITLAEVGTTCFIVDDQTVAKTSPNDTRAAAGVVVDVDGDGVWVDVGPTVTGSIA